MKHLFILVFFLIAAFVGCTSESITEHDHEEEATGIHSDEAHDADTHDESREMYSGDTSGINLLTIREQPFSFILRTGGRISVDSRDIIKITANSSGIVKMYGDYLFPGVKISKGDVLFTISGAQLAEGNSELNFRQVTADLDRASANYERAKKLIADKIITEGDFLDAKNEYEKLLNTYENLSATQGKNGNIVTAGVNGYIKEVYVTEGEKVSPGEQLASLVIDHNLVLRADVSPDKSEMLNKITDANFKVGYSDKVYRLSEMNGSKISQGKSTGANSYYIPVFFRMDYTPELIEGTFAEVYLIGSQMSSAIVVPNSALMEEFGKMYVFIADPDGEFLKRYVVTGNSDGQQTEIISGLSEGESIVAEGTYRVKLMQQNTNPPSHNH